MKTSAFLLAVWLTALSGTVAAQTPVHTASLELLAALRARDVAAIEARFAPSMHEALPHDKFKATMDQILAGLGPLGACGELRTRPRDGVTSVETRCEFEKSPMSVKMAWTESLQLAGLLIVPEPQPLANVPLPSGVTAQTLVTGAEGWPLPATLVMPGCCDKPPVVVFVHGSGPNDRDETIAPNRPFLDLALGFAVKGIASLRYDKRTRALGDRFAAELKNYTLDDEIVDDAVAALRVVAARKDLGPVFIVGHSEGAWLAPRIAARAGRQGVKVAGVVMLAGNVTPVADLLVYQYEFLSGLPVPAATPAMVEDVKRRRDNVARLVARVAAGGVDPASLTAADTGPLPLDAPASLWADMGRYDPVVALLAQPALPALLTFGERDFQVPIGEKTIWETRLGARPRTTIVAFAGMNHLLFEAQGPMTPAEYARVGHVSPRLIDQVADWIKRESVR